MKKIVVCGAGHGGLVAAKNLAEAGYDVTLYERAARDGLGYDWCDCLYKGVFEDVNIKTPDESVFAPFMDMHYYPPSKSISFKAETTQDYPVKYVERKALLKHLIDEAEAAGVKLLFSATILNALTVGYKVRGVTVEIDGKRREVFCDLVIDSCGYASPVRRSLPREFGFVKEIPTKDTFNVYRAYYLNKSGKVSSPTYNIYFFHCGKAGMDWLIEEGDHYDVLIGSFGDLPEGAIEAAVADFKADFPNMSDEIVRGGSVERIPLRKAFSKLVTNGYALVGDSASMVEALSGSGITKSMVAGKILSDTVLAIGEGELSVSELWAYQYRYFKQIGEKDINDAVIKETLASLSADDIDFLCTNGILTEKEIKKGVYTFPEIIRKCSIFKKPELVKTFAKACVKIVKFGNIKKMLPEKYDRDSVLRWANAYDSI